MDCLMDMYFEFLSPGAAEAVEYMEKRHLASDAGKPEIDYDFEQINEKEVM